MARLRAENDNPWFWVTSIAGLLSGDKSCEWSAWFQAVHDRNSWIKQPDTFDQARWKEKHTRLSHPLRQKYLDRGYIISIERQNRFDLKGRVATISGSPDLVVSKNDEGIIIDVKTGQPRITDITQVKLYMWLYRSKPNLHQNVENFNGCVVYKDHEVPIPASEIDNEFITGAAGLINRLARKKSSPVRVPSLFECRYCKITLADCEERIDHYDKDDDGQVTDLGF